MLKGYLGILFLLVPFKEDYVKIEPITEIEYRVGVINSIAKTHKSLRQQSKSCTFSQQYGGTYRTLMVNSGFDEETAKTIESNYNQAYKVTKTWEDALIKQASKDGYVTCAFGLRLRTPLLKQTLLNVSATPQAATGEQRTAINAVQQSWGLLNTRAGIETMKQVRSNQELRLSIRPSSQIHDSQYFIVRNDTDTLFWLNEVLVKEVNWNHDPKIHHPEINLGGNLSVFYPAWDKELEVPNNITKPKLEQLANDYVSKLNP